MSSEHHSLFMPGEDAAVNWTVDTEDDCTHPWWTTIGLAGMVVLLAVEAVGAWYIVAS